jgi:hypothetical protein
MMQTPASGHNLSTIAAFVYVFLGIVLSLVIPVLRKLASPPGGDKDVNPPSWLVRLWPIAKPYVLLAALSLALSVVTLAIAQAQDVTMQYWYQPFLLGYFFDSTIQKFKP